MPSSESDSSSGKSKIKKFKGESGFQKWATHVMIELSARDLWSVVSGIEPRPEAKTRSDDDSLHKWIRKEHKALSLIYGALSSSVQPILSESMTSRDLWLYLKETYGKQTNADIAHLASQIFLRTKKLNETMNTYLTSMENLFNEVNGIKANIFPTELFIIKLCTGVPIEFSPITTAILSDESKTLTSTKRLLLNAATTIEANKTVSSKSGDGVALQAKTSGDGPRSNRPPCIHCNKPGHPSDNCYVKFPEKRPPPPPKEESKEEPKPKAKANQASTAKGNKKTTEEQSINMAVQNQASQGETALMARSVRPKANVAIVKEDLESAHVAKQEERLHMLVDCGASRHMFKDPQCFETTEPAETTIQTCDSTHDLSATGIGTAHVAVANNRFAMSNSLLVPDLSLSLISLGLIQRNGGQYHSSGLDKMIIKAADGASFEAVLGSDNLYHVHGKATGTNHNHNEVALSSKTLPLSTAAYSSNSDQSRGTSMMPSITKSWKEWHDLFGHPGQEALEKTLRYYNLGVVGQPQECGPCKRGKFTRLPYDSRNPESFAQDKLERVHTDVAGPLPTPSFSGNIYFLTFIDEATNYCWAIPLKDKSSVTYAFQTWLTYAEREAGTKLKCLRSDNGGEYINHTLENFLNSRGIRHERTAPRTPQQNGKAERLNRSILDRFRTWREATDLPEAMWAELIITACWLKNRTWSKVVNDVPAKLWLGSTPDVQHLIPVGPCYVHVSYKNTETSKLETRAVNGVVIGYQDARTYRVWVDNKVVRTRHAQARHPDADTVPQSASDVPPSTMEYNVTHEIPTTALQTSVLEPFTVNPTVPLHQEENLTAYLARQREENGHMSTTLRLDEAAFLSMHRDADVPATYQEALQSADAHHWKAAIQSELDSLVKNNTWTKTDLPSGRTAITNKWLFKIKRDHTGAIVRYKARLVVRGFSQIEGLDYHETFAPVSRLSSLRVFLAVCLQLKLHIHHLDVETAFLNGRCDEELYMAQPFGCTDGTNKVLRLNKSLYGLKQAPRIWNETMDAVLRQEGFNKSPAEGCLYERKRHHAPYIAILEYVDDYVVAGTSRQSINDLLTSLRRHFVINDLGPIHYYLGLNIHYDQSSGTMKVSQSTYIRAILEQYQIPSSSTADTPMAVKTRTYSSGSIDPVTSTQFNKTDYAQAIGKLLYAALGTRIDIAYAVQYLSRKTSNPTLEDWRGVQRVLKYLNKTTDHAIVYTQSTQGPVGFCDSNFADADDSHSTSGWVFMLSGGPVTWSTKRQTKTAVSTQEAELNAAFSAAREALWLAKFHNMHLFKFLQRPMTPITIFCDSQGALAFIANTGSHARTKHYDIELNFLREISPDILQFKYVPTKQQIADFLTKPLAAVTFQQLLTEAHFS
ncbi:unnamed protein product [Jaminaea pallidilutea]